MKGKKNTMRHNILNTKKDGRKNRKHYVFFTNSVIKYNVKHSMIMQLKQIKKYLNTRDKFK